MRWSLGTGVSGGVPAEDLEEGGLEEVEMVRLGGEVVGRGRGVARKGGKEM